VLLHAEWLYVARWGKAAKAVPGFIQSFSELTPLGRIRALARAVPYWVVPGQPQESSRRRWRQCPFPANPVSIPEAASRQVGQSGTDLPGTLPENTGGSRGC